jgi:hypothetical protein
MSMLYVAQTAAEARPGVAIGYITAKLLMISGAIYGLIRLVSRKRRSTSPPAPPNYGAPHGYAPNYWATQARAPHGYAPNYWAARSWPTQGHAMAPSHMPPWPTPMAQSQTPPWPPQSPPPAPPR